MLEVEVAERDARVHPAEVYFGGTKVGGTVQSLVQLSSLSGNEITVEKAESAGPGLEVNPGDRPNEFRVRQRVTRPGLIEGVVSFSVRTKDGVERVELKVSAVGVEVAEK